MKPLLPSLLIVLLSGGFCFGQSQLIDSLTRELPILEHSRTATGEKRPTDLNALADEYLRLSYQGMRAKNKNVTVTLQTDFVANLPPIDVVPQEIGRVLLNLYNNAFYAVHEKQKTAPADYQPTVSVSTT